MSNSIHPVFNKTKDLSKEKLDKLAKQIDHEVFEKTDCLACGNCCKSAPPIITNQDIKRIARFLKVSPKQVFRQYVIQDFNGEMSFDQVPCNFLGEDNYCSIYEARPNACRDYPHVHSGNFNARRKLHSKNAKICPAVEEILQKIEMKLPYIS